MIRVQMAMRISVSLVVFALLLAPALEGRAFRQVPTARLLVMPFSVESDATGPANALSTKWLGEAAATLLADELAAKGYPTFPRDDRVAVFDRLHLPMSPELTHATMIRVAELMGASAIVFGDVHVGRDLTVRARTMRIETGRLMPDVTDRGALAELFDVFGRVATQVGPQVGRPVAAVGARQSPMALGAFESYVKGLIAATPAAQQRFLESAMTQAPRDGRVLTALWSVYADQGLHEKALSVASAVPADAPQLRRARFDVALSLIELKRFDGAAKELTTLYEQKRSAAVSNALALTELRRGAAPAAAQKAAVFFERAANEAPDDADLLFNLGYARALANDGAGALLWLRETVRHSAADGDAHLVMGVVLASSGRAAEAQRELDLARTLGTALDAVPATLTKIPPSLERVRTRLDDSAVAPIVLSPTQTDQRETAAFHLKNGRALVQDGRDREAAAELQRSIYLAPYEDEPHLLLGRVFERAGRVSEAIDEFKVAVWCRETGAARLALGRVLAASGDREAARRELERALVLTPDSTEARELLRKIGG